MKIEEKRLYCQETDPGKGGVLSRRRVNTLIFLAGPTIWVCEQIQKLKRATSFTLRVREALDARENPKGIARATKDPKLEETQLFEEQLEQIYQNRIAPFIDTKDKQPIIKRGTFFEQMYWIHGITYLLYNQMDRKNRPTYADFVDKYIQETVEMCSEVGLHPAVFLETMVVSGQNIYGLKTQREDISIYQAQVLIDAFQEVASESGDNSAGQLIQFIASDPYNFIFQEDNQVQIQSWLDKIGANIRFQGRIKLMRESDAMRLLIPTIGTMDMETDIYAEALDFLKAKYPNRYNQYFGQYQEARSALKLLADKRKVLQQYREKLEETMSQVLQENPLMLDAFFDKETGFQEFVRIGIGGPGFGYTRDSFAAILYGEQYYNWATGIIEIPKDIDRESYFQKRSSEVLNATLSYYQEKYEQDPEIAKKELIADQIFNPLFIAALKSKLSLRNNFKIYEALSLFNEAARQVKKARFETFVPIGTLEYDWRFQAALSVTTTRRLKELVIKTLPEIDGTDRNQLYWQMYMITLVREISAFPALIGRYLRPDIDPPYNPAVFIQKVLNLYNAYKDRKMIQPDALPNDFVAFSKAEWAWYRSRFAKDYTNQGITKEDSEIIDAIYKKNIGHTYSAWVRSLTVGPRVEQDRVNPNG